MRKENTKLIISDKDIKYAIKKLEESDKIYKHSGLIFTPFEIILEKAIQQAKKEERERIVKLIKYAIVKDDTLATYIRINQLLDLEFSKQ